MRWIAAVFVVLLAATPALGITVHDVIEMTEAGLSDEVIVSQIRATHSQFDLTVDEIIALSEAGVSDGVLAAMIATAFGDVGDYEYGDVGYRYEDTYRDDDRYVVVEEEPETHTFIHVGLGRHYWPYSYVWWDYWWPPFDYYWYADSCIRADWCWRYRPWWYTGHYYSWWYDPCRRPRGCGFRWQRDCDRYCSVDRPRDRVRWKTHNLGPMTTLATSRTRTKAIRDAQRGRTQGPLAQLEPVRTKTSRYRSPALASADRRGAGTYRQYGQALSRTKTRATVVDRTGSRPKTSTAWNPTSRGTYTKRKPPRSGASITPNQRVRTDRRSTPAIRSTKTRSGSGSPAAVRSKAKSSQGSSKATRPSVRSSSRSKSSSPAARSSGSRSGSSRSKGSSGSSSSKKRR